MPGRLPGRYVPPSEGPRAAADPPGVPLDVPDARPTALSLVTGDGAGKAANRAKRD
jgi:hypothetical protein